MKGRAREERGKMGKGGELCQKSGCATEHKFACIPVAAVHINMSSVRVYELHSCQLF